MKTIGRTAMAIAFMTALGVSAQLKEVDKANKKTQAANEGIKETTQTLKETKQTLDEVGAMFGGLLGSKNHIVIAITNIEFDNGDLSRLYNAISGMKGVKKPSKNLNEKFVSIQLSSKAGATGVWDQIPAELKKPFKIREANGNILGVDYLGNQPEEQMSEEQ